MSLFFVAEKVKKLKKQVAFNLLWDKELWNLNLISHNILKRGVSLSWQHVDIGY